MSSSNASPPFDFSRKLALVTGATGGIGRATAISLASAGYDVVLHYHQAPQSTRDSLVSAVTAAAASAAASSSGPPSMRPPADRARLVQADLSEPGAGPRLWAAAVEAFGGVAPGVVVINAGSTGGISKPASIEAVDADVFERTWRVNTLAPYELARCAVPHMTAAGYGRVVFTSSVAGITGGVVGPHYASSKAALHGLVHWLARNVARSGVTVNAVAPALIEQTAMLPGGSEELRNMIPVGRLGTPEEVAGTIMWMVGNGYVTNKVIAVDGGMAVQ